ncbi:uncharacterized protein LOC123711132 isoform X1 [Pieris brassicae]|uniref:uncharacterized protein LOC123711132 isoform X1 n=2 Tax=Pieris brassicae TaxID=7116 RepID=UPI001E65E91D|nr:uncharacterized protein LOC123711132 isoform X1 [Pieris brassicae]
MLAQESQTEPSNGNKNRTPSRCREWERQRRLKFNEAIAKLGELVLTINKENGDTANDKSGSTQFPKIEIIQKAIICLTNFTHEKSKLKAEVLALEVKLQGFKKLKCDTKDECVQVTLGTGRGKQNNKYMKLLRLKKCKNNLDNKDDKPQKSGKDPPKSRKALGQLPKLLPLPSKKENTIVMLPATPYIFPQRPILFPTATPTFVLLDTNLQSLNKLPIVNRNIHDITKTTMVNVLPISAYSRPLSAAKTKRNSKPKSTVKKGTKKKDESNVSQIPVSTKETLIRETSKDVEEKKKTDTDSSAGLIEQSAESTNTVNTDSSEKQISTQSNSVNNTEVPKETNTSEENFPAKISSENQESISQMDKTSMPLNTNVGSHAVPNTKPAANEPATTNKNTEFKDNKDQIQKDSKLQNILQQPICENVDAGNARLELAEEFLAASPTAAFLMSFPLVSGNRADSPNEETPQSTNLKENTCRTELPPQSFFEKQKPKPISKPQNESIKTTIAEKNQNPKILNKIADIKPPMTTANASVGSENPFLNLPLPTIVTTNCSITDSSFGLDFDCNVSKAPSNQPANYVSSNALFYKSDPFASVKNTVYSTSSLSSGHEYNSLGLYPCAVDNYSSKNKTDFPNIDENLMKINSSRLTYDIDLGWSHKSLDFNCTTTSNSLHKDNIFTSTPSTYSSSYNPFNPEFHASLSNVAKKDLLTSKSSTFTEAITSFYSQTGNLWADDVSSIFANASATKNTLSKNQQYTEPNQVNSNVKASKQYDSKHNLINLDNHKSHTTVTGNQHNVSEKYTKKSPSKMHINWMTSETRPSQNNCQQIQSETKENYKANYGHINASRKVGQNENYFPINMHHFPSQNNHEELQMWPPTKPAGTAEISIEPPPIHLPTLVGDLALGPHEKKRNDLINRGIYQADQNCSNFFSVTQLMNRSSDIPTSRSHATNIEQKPNTKHNLSQIVSDTSRKSINPRESNLQHCYGFGEAKVTNNFDALNQFSHTKSKTNKQEKNAKQQKNNYSAEALIRGGTCSQKVHENNTKFIIPSQKFGDFNVTHDTSVAQVSHYPPLLDYSENSYVGQQYSTTTLYNSTANTMPNTFYSNFMQNGSNLMPSSYTGGPFTGEFVDYNQSSECNYVNHKYDDIKLRNNTNFHQDKSTRREVAKHKLDCKKETTKKYPTKRSKITTESEEWGENTNILWQNKGMNKRHTNMMSEELQFPNLIGNQMPTQYQPDFLNTHLMPSNVQSVGSNVHGERTSSTFPVASRSNFNLSTLFPEITMKVQ